MSVCTLQSHSPGLTGLSEDTVFDMWIFISNYKGFKMLDLPRNITAFWSTQSTLWEQTHRGHFICTEASTEHPYPPTLTFNHLT